MNEKKLSSREQRDGFEEKRSYPRVVIETPVSLALPDSSIVEAQAYDISFEGLQIHCNQEAAHLLQNYESSEIEISFTLPVRDRQAAIKARCAIMYILELFNNTHAMGVRITGIETGTMQEVRQFIENSMETD